MSFQHRYSSATSAPAIVWFRQDLRLADNPALHGALASGPAIALYILDEKAEENWRLGGASRWWLHHSLAALARSLEARGSRLILRRGPSAATLEKLIAETGARAVLWNSRCEPHARRADEAIKRALTEKGIKARSFNGALLFEPGAILTNDGTPFRVFTPFWRAALKAPPPIAPLPAPRRIDGPGAWPASDRLDDWRLLPQKPDWSAGLRAQWVPGEVAAQKRLADFLDGRLDAYRQMRDLPGVEATSRLSAHLHFGEISPRRIWHTLKRLPPGAGGDKFLSELGWREFNHHLLVHYPDLPVRNFRAEFDAFPWRDDDVGLTAWRRGCTGYPIVDAGMRQLWQTGWMHNRVRMIAASFLVKHLLIDWRVGQDWFWDTLVDADLANNACGWQWVAGCGADAAPYFRIFNPILQGEKFDADGSYIRRWVPELARLDCAYIHKPWLASSAILAGAGLRLGVDYPTPIVAHDFARRRALAAFASLRKQAA